MPALLASFVLTELPLSMVPISVILLVQDVTGRIGLAGLSLGLYTAGGAVTGPLLGRAVDRLGQARVVATCGISSGAGLGAAVVAAATTAPTWMLLVAVAGAGLVQPPTSGALRALLADLAGTAGVPTSAAFGLESILVEVSFIAGPIVAGAMLAAAPTGFAVALAATLRAGGSVLYAANPIVLHARGQPPRREGGRPSQSAFAVLVASVILIGSALGAIVVGATGLASTRHVAGGVGALLFLQGLGSATGGAVYGATEWRRPPSQKYAALSVAFGLGIAPLIFLNEPPTVYVVMFGSGLFLAPALAACFETFDMLASPATRAELQGWASSAIKVGQAVGTTASGFLIGMSLDAVFGLCLVAAALAGLMVAPRAVPPTPDPIRLS